MIRLTILSVLAVIGTCNAPKQEKTETNEFTNIDSLLQRSKENAIVLDEASRKSDTSIAGKVEKTVKKMAVMEKQIIQLKAENNELKEQIDSVYTDNADAGKPFNIRSVSSD